LGAVACYDSEDQCGENQRFSEADQLCVCRNGFTVTAEGCRPASAAPAPAGDDVSEDGGAAGEDEPAGPEGLGEPCTTNADCAGTDATFCDTLITQSCLVEGCALGGSDCLPGYECQDLSMFGAAGNVCVAAVCDLAANDCPEGFTCCEAPIPGFPATCLSRGCGG
jgi:hypothetical protein